VNVDGISVGSAFNGAGVSSYIADVGNAREVTMTTSGGLGEAEGGGPSLNIVPKEGGNSVRGSFYTAGVTEGMIGSNYSRGAARAGCTTPGETRKVWDFNSAWVDRSSRTGVVLFTSATRAASAACRHVREQQRGRPDEVDLRGGQDGPPSTRRVVPILTKR
jgi:hypothetical protein